MVGFKGRAGRFDRRRKSTDRPEGSRKVDRRRKSKIGRKVKPEGTTTDESRRLGSWTEPEGWQSAQAGSQSEGEAGKLAAGESRRLAGRHSRRVGQRRKPMVGTTAQSESRPRRKSMVGTTVQSENRPEAQADGWRNGWAGRSIEGASRRKVGRLSWKIDRWRKPERGRKAESADAATDESRRLGLKAGPEGRSKAQAGG